MSAVVLQISYSVYARTLAGEMLTRVLLQRSVPFCMTHTLLEHLCVYSCLTFVLCSSAVCTLSTTIPECLPAPLYAVSCCIRGEC